MEITLEELLQATIDEGASDLHIRAYMPPSCASTATSARSRTNS